MDFLCGVIGGLIGAPIGWLFAEWCRTKGWIK